jgi:hypothetical protein
MKINEILIEGVAGPKNCWPGYRKTGTQPGTGKNKGKRVNDCEKIKEDAEDLNEFAAGGDDDSGDDPYRYPKPKHFSRSIDFFGQFEAEHFDREDMNDATGEFKGYWGKDQLAYFKFDNPQRTGNDDPGMGWYYEPNIDSDSGDTSTEPAVDDSAQRKQQELGMIRAFLKSGNQPSPGSQIYNLMKRHGMVEGLNEFALPGSGDDREPDEEEILRQLAAKWWLGTEQQMAQAQKTLEIMGWEIGQDESGDDDAGVFLVRPGDENGDTYTAFNHSDLEGLSESTLGTVLSWPKVANEISSAMRAMGWKVQRKGDDAFMFSTKGRESDDQYYIIMVDNEGDNFFHYALGTFEGGRPDIGFEGTLPTTSASVSEVLMAIRDGYGLDESLVEEFDLIESIVESLAERNSVDAEVIWEDLESLSDDELYVFAVTTPIMEDWQKANKRDKTDGMSKKAVNAYRRENPGSKLKTAVTTKPSKLKKGSKASKRRKSYCSRSRGQMKMHSISCAKTPDKAICKARRRWNC